MNIAAHHSMIGGKKKWVNPYTAGSVINMWDAEWNAGSGIHSADLTNLMDCVGDSNAMLSQSSSAAPTYSNKGFIFGGASAYNFTPSSALKAAHSAKSLTIEIVCRVTGYASTNRGILSLSPVTNNEGAYNGNPYIRIYADGSYAQDSFYVSNTSSVQTTPGKFFRNGLLLNEIYTLGIVISSSYANFYLNGVSVANHWFKGTSSTSPTLGCIGAKSGTSGLFQACNLATIYNIRIHNKQCTAAELAALYAIDASRFAA